MVGENFTTKLPRWGEAQDTFFLGAALLGCSSSAYPPSRACTPAPGVSRSARCSRDAAPPQRVYQVLIMEHRRRPRTFSPRRRPRTLQRSPRAPPYLADRFTDLPIWPEDAALRARARSLCAEMHCGFSALRNHCIMNIGVNLSRQGRILWRDQPALRRDIARIENACE